MELTAVESSNIQAVGYDEHTRELRVQFKRKGGGDGPIYRYRHVPPHIHMALMNAPTKGGYFAAEIKGKYEAEKL